MKLLLKRLTHLSHFEKFLPTRLLGPTHLLNLKISSHLHCYLDSTLIWHPRVIEFLMFNQIFSGILPLHIFDEDHLYPSQFCIIQYATHIFELEPKSWLRYFAMKKSLIFSFLSHKSGNKYMVNCYQIMIWQLKMLGSICWYRFWTYLVGLLANFG